MTFFHFYLIKCIRWASSFVVFDLKKFLSAIRSGSYFMKDLPQQKCSIDRTNGT